MQVTYCNNPLSLNSDIIALPDLGEHLSPNEIIAANALCFSRPVICMVNGDIWGRADWNHPVPVRAHVRFIEFPRGGNAGRTIGMAIVTVAAIAATWYVGGAGGLGMGAAWGAAAGAAVSITGSLLLGVLFPLASSGSGESGTSYSLTGSNSMRIDEPYAERFGRKKFYPDLAQAAFVRRSNMNPQYNAPQYLYSLMILGIGEFDIEGVYIEETPIDDYDEDVEHNIIEPGETPTLVTDVVYVSTEVNNIELDHADWSTYIVNPRGTRINVIEFDIEFPSGLIGHVSVTTQCRTVNDSGVAASDWVDLRTHHFGEQAITKSWGKTFRNAVPLGLARYEFRIRRLEAETKDTDNSEKAYLGSLRGFAGKHPAVPGVTMLEVLVKASSQLNGDVANKINVIATRKLYPLLSTGFGSVLTATRSIVDAVAYMVTSTNGGQQDDSILVWDELYDLSTLLVSEGYYFDWAFTSRCSVMDAAAKAGRCGMAVPYTPGGLFSLVPDRQQSGVSMVFSGATGIDEGSLKITHNFNTPDAYDSVRVKYIDAENWTEYYIDIGDGTENPYEITLEGCTSREQAWKYGMRAWKEIQLTTTNVEWTTGLLGHLPTLFSWVGVGETSIDWGQTGVIAAAETGLIWLSEPVDFGDEESGWLMLQATGVQPGPYSVTPTDYAHCVACASIPVGLKSIQNDGVAATPYIFGPAAEDVHVVRITSITPSGRNSISIAGDVANADAYDMSGDIPDPGSGITVDPLVTVSIYASVIGDESQTVVCGWSGSADSFLVEIKEGGDAYVIIEDGITTYTTSLETGLEDITLRVTPYVDGVLDTDYQLTAMLEYEPPSTLEAPVNVVIQSLLSAGAIITWDVVDGATGYVVYVGTKADFDPATEGTLKYSGTGNSATISLNLSSPYIYLIKVAATNVIHKLVDILVFSDPEIITDKTLVIDNAEAIITDESGTIIYV